MLQLLRPSQTSLFTRRQQQGGVLSPPPRYLLMLWRPPLSLVRFTIMPTILFTKIAPLYVASEAEVMDDTLNVNGMPDIC